MNTNETENVNTISTEQHVLTAEDLPDKVNVIGVTFRDSNKLYHFAANGIVAAEGSHVIVETARGIEYGKVTVANSLIPKTELVLPLKKVLRVATDEDNAHLEENHRGEEEAFAICQKKIAEHGLDMKLIDVEYTFDNAKLLFYFTSDDRVDFRELVKDLAGAFRTRIELRQIGIRDETKLLGGLGVCYREYCCHSFLSDFTQVSIKMAKEQGLSLNSAKISGACGRLMCCLKFEHETYQEEIKLTPKVGAQLVTPDGTGTVIEAKPLVGLVKVKLDADPDGAPKVYDRNLVRLKTEADEITKRGEKVERHSSQGFVPFTMISSKDEQNVTGKGASRQKTVREARAKPLSDESFALRMDDTAVEKRQGGQRVQGGRQNQRLKSRRSTHGTQDGSDAQNPQSAPNAQSAQGRKPSARQDGIEQTANAAGQSAQRRVRIGDSKTDKYDRPPAARQESAERLERAERRNTADAGEKADRSERFDRRPPRRDNRDPRKKNRPDKPSDK